MMKQSVEFIEYLDFTDLLDGKCIVAVGIGPAREAILLTVDPESKSFPFGRDGQPGWVSFPQSMVGRPYPSTVIRLNTTLINRIDLPEVEADFPHIQPLADGETFIVSARCGYNKGNPDHNVVIYDQQGLSTRRMTFGDGIEDVQVSRDQLIWVSYFDEGILGNYGWPHPPNGPCGLLCFDINGQIVRRFQAPGGFDSMVDCYALNVSDDAVWVCYYTDFPVVQITKNGVHGWENKFRGAKALAIDRQRVLLWGGYEKERERCIVQTIADEKLVSPQKLDLHLPNGKSLEKAKIIGRGSILHAFVGTTWYQFDLRDLQ